MVACLQQPKWTKRDSNRKILRANYNYKKVLEIVRPSQHPLILSHALGVVSVPWLLFPRVVCSLPDVELLRTVPASPARQRVTVGKRGATSTLEYRLQEEAGRQHLQSCISEAEGEGSSGIFKHLHSLLCGSCAVYTDPYSTVNIFQS